MLFDNPDKSWESLGKTDPYYGVVTEEKFRRKTFDSTRKAEFFAQGRLHMERVLQRAEAVTHPIPRKRALDFGCGVGRLVLPLAKEAGFSEVCGIDISPSMLAEAARNAEEAGIDNVELVLADDSLSRVRGEFDFIHSYIVLQHIPVRRGEEIVRSLVGRLSPGGVAALQMPFARDASWLRKAGNAVRVNVRPLHMLGNVIQGRPWDQAPMQMNRYNMNSLLEMLHAAGCHVVTLELAVESANLGAYVFVQRAA